MPNYRRAAIPGGSYFFTVVTHERRPILTSPLSRNNLRVAFLTVQNIHPFQVEAICLLPDHLHCIWTLPESDADFSTRWKEIKSLFSHLYLQEGGKPEPVSESKQQKGEQGIWQRRFWEHYLRDEEDFKRHVEYIHYNPVKHGLAQTVSGWPWSSFHRYVKEGYYPPDWGTGDRWVGYRLFDVKE